MEIIRNRHQKGKPTSALKPAPESAETFPSSLDNIVRREYLVSRIYQILFTKTAYPIEKHYLRGHLIRQPNEGEETRKGDVYVPGAQLLPVIIVSDICAIVVTEDCGVWFEFNAKNKCASFIGSMMGRMVFADFRVFLDTMQDPFHMVYKRGDDLDFQGYVAQCDEHNPFWIELRLYNRDSSEEKYLDENGRETDELTISVLKMVRMLQNHRAFLFNEDSMADIEAILQVIRDGCYGEEINQGEYDKEASADEKDDVRMQQQAFAKLSPRGMAMYRKYVNNYVGKRKSQRQRKQR